MKKYEYDNASVYITIPTEEQVENIKKSTEKFLTKIVKEYGYGVFERNRESNRRAR